MADLVSPIIDIISRLWPCCARQTRYLRKLQENKMLLSTAMEELKEARDDLQRRVDEAEADPNKPNKRTDEVRGWIQRVEIIEGEVKKILLKAGDQPQQYFSRGSKCLGRLCPPNKCWSNYKLGKSVVRKMASVNELKGKGHFQEVTYQLPPPLVQDINLESTVGMEAMFDKVWRLVTSKDEKVVRIMGLYGQGGVGKTTLLQHINNEFHKKISTTGEHGFDHYVVIFVLVSKPINYKAIQKKIGERLGLSDSLQGDGDGDDENNRAEKIFNVLRNKNYVLLLDDIWERVDLRRIGIPIHHPQGNSKLIFTTRLERVCGDMGAKKFKVDCLPKDKAWILFQEMVGEEALNSFPDARELAKVVAKECDGLPLALITIGRAMSTKKSVQEWNDAIITLQRYASELQDMRDKVLPSLKLSYDYLHNETEKSCFRYCSLYPEDYSININKLIDYWIAEGFLDGFDNLGAARHRGHTIIGSLKSACLLESSDEPNHEKTHVKMHDVIRDLALWIVNDCSTGSSSSTSTDQSDSHSDDNKFLVAVNDPCEKWENAERIFWDADSTTTRNSSNEEENPPTSSNLLTLIVQKSAMSWPQSFFQHMPLLRVLDLSNTHCFNDEFPISICELHELQYLNLSQTTIRKLPVELRKLVKLKFLVLVNTRRLRRIQIGLIANISELQVLDLGCAENDQFSYVENWELEDGPSFSELDGLKQLQDVRITIITYVAFEKFLCNRKLQMICTGLRFRKSYKTSSSTSSRRVLDLSNFKSLKDLNISGFSELEELVLYGSSTIDGGLLSNLETLSLDLFPKLNNILWMAAAQPDLLHSNIQSLHSISIVKCNALKDLTWLVYVQNLKTLIVKECEGLETVIELDDQMLNTGGAGGRGGVFGRLETLQIWDLPKLKSICRHALVFPYVKTIRINLCPELKKLPLGYGSNVNNTLKVIRGQSKWWNELQWEDETIKSKFLPYFSK